MAKMKPKSGKNLEEYSYFAENSYLCATKSVHNKEIHNNTMEKKFKRTTVTSALPYANGPVHIGHLAGVYVPADIYVRYLRLKRKM